MSSDMQKKKLAEAQDHMRQAEKCMKTSLLKWRPDLDGAADHYSKAAVCYRNAKAIPEAKEAYIKAAGAQLQMNSHFHAAKSYEQAGLLCKENKMIEEAIHLLEHAAKLFQENGTPDTAALTLDKAAKAVELSHPTKAIQLYEKACDVSEIEDKTRQCAEFIGKAGRLLVQQQRYDEAVKDLGKEMEFHAATENFETMYRLVIAIVLIHLTRGDPVEAEKFLNASSSIPGFDQREEAALCYQLLESYNEGDADGCRDVLTRPLIKFMDNAFARLARDLNVPEGMSRKSAAPQYPDIPVAPPGGGKTSRVQLDDEDMEGGGLC